MRGFFKLLAIWFLLIGLLGFAREAQALVCCGYYSCTKYSSDPIPVPLDDYLAQCGGASCGGGCPAGYTKGNDECNWSSGSCGGGGEP